MNEKLDKLIEEIKEHAKVLDDPEYGGSMEDVLRDTIGPFLLNQEAPGQLTFADLRAVDVPRCTRDFRHALDSWSPAEWTNALCGEAGEAANIAKKILRLVGGMAGNVDGDRDLAGLKARLVRELADVVIYADLCAAALGMDLAEAIVEKFNEVSIRIGSSFRLPHQGGV